MDRGLKLGKQRGLFENLQRLTGILGADSDWIRSDPIGYGWAFGLPKKFGSGISGFLKFGFSKMLPEVYSEKSIPDISGNRKFGFGFGFTRNTR